MELDIFGFQFGKKEPSKQKKEDKLLQSFTVPEMFDGTVTVEAGGFFGTALDYGVNLRDENTSVIQYRNMSVFPEIDNAVDEIVNASIELPIFSNAFTFLFSSSNFSSSVILILFY